MRIKHTGGRTTNYAPPPKQRAAQVALASIKAQVERIIVCVYPDGTSHDVKVTTKRRRSVAVH